MGRADATEVNRCAHCGQALPSLLTPRQQEVLTLLVEGLTTQEIAARLYVSHKTVEAHIAHMYLRSGTRHRMGLIRWGCLQGLVMIPHKEEMP